MSQRSLWVTADLQDERFPEGRVENNGEREKEVGENNKIVLSRMWHTGVLLCWQGLNSVVMIGEGNRIEEI